MKTLSLWQPWASLMAYEFKRIETRSWATKYRGPLLIHAAKRPMTMIHKEAVMDFDSIMVDYFSLPRGSLLAVVNLIDCVPVEQFAADIKYWREHAHGDFRPGRWAWVTEFVKRLDLPIPYRGRQGLFEIMEYDK
jgi:hypothetical protein